MDRVGRKTDRRPKEIQKSEPGEKIGQKKSGKQEKKERKKGKRGIGVSRSNKRKVKKTPPESGSGFVES